VLAAYAVLVEGLPELKLWNRHLLNTADDDTRLIWSLLQTQQQAVGWTSKLAQWLAACSCLLDCVILNRDQISNDTLLNWPRQICALHHHVKLNLHAASDLQQDRQNMIWWQASSACKDVTDCFCFFSTIDTGAQAKFTS